jgi:acetyltransferase-like isoleucine patch superfamily enzyme
MADADDARGAFARHDLGITPFWQTAPAADRRRQQEWLTELTHRGDVSFGADVFVSTLAAVYPDHLALGDRTYVSAHTVFWGDIELGPDCTLNPFSELRGHVRIGSGVRIGAHTSVLGFNHATAVDRPIHEQPLTSRGVTIEDDVWVGSHVVVLDGVTIGSHSIVGAGSVVTKDVAPWSVVAGNPARRLRDRRTGTGDGTNAGTSAVAGTSDGAVAGTVAGSVARTGDAVTDALRRIDELARRDAPAILQRCWDEAAGSFVDHPGAGPTVRAWCDAVELAELLGAWPAMPVDRERCAEELRSRQDPATGLVPDWSGAGSASGSGAGSAAGSEGRSEGRSDGTAAPSADGHAGVNYHVLAAGYALALLGTGFEHPVRAVGSLSSGELRRALEAQPWARQGWRAGAWVDAVGTAMHWNRTRFSLDTELDTLIGWLVRHCDPATGLWSPPDQESGWLEAVNGFYRLTRGTFAQVGVPLPYPERTIDSVLAHAADDRWFGPHRGTACNVLDVIHPLWLAGKQTGHRRAEGEDWARRQLERVARSWHPGRGFSFALEPGDGWQRAPGLLGTEMWLSITWLLADHLGASDILEYRPRGVHRPEPATTPSGTPR